MTLAIGMHTILISEALENGLAPREFSILHKLHQFYQFYQLPNDCAHNRSMKNSNVKFDVETWFEVFIRSSTQKSPKKQNQTCFQS